MVVQNVRSVDEAIDSASRWGFPVQVASAFSLGGKLKIAHDEIELRVCVAENLALSPIREVELKFA